MVTAFVFSAHFLFGRRIPPRKLLLIALIIDGVSAAIYWAIQTGDTTTAHSFH